MRKYLIGFFVLVNVYCFKVATIRNSNHPEQMVQVRKTLHKTKTQRLIVNSPVNCREFREFAREFALHMKGYSDPSNSKFVKDINVTKSMKVLWVEPEKCTHCFLIVRRMFWNFRKASGLFFDLSIDNLPQNLNWQDGSEEHEFASLKQKKVEHGKSLREIVHQERSARCKRCFS